MRTQPVPWLMICSIRPLRRARSWVTTPRKSSGTSTVSRSTGSWTLPSTSLVRTCGLPTVSSKPSRRIISTSTASCSSPRPWTSQVSGRSVGRTWMLTLPTSSRSSRPFTRRAVSRVPSLPASGDVLMPMVIDRLGSSMCGIGQRAWVLEVGEGLADGDLGDAGDGDDLAGADLGGRHAVELLGDEELGDLGPLGGAVRPAPGHGLALADVAVDHPAQRDAAQVRRRVEVRDQRLERRVGVVGRRGDALEQEVEERLQGCALGEATPVHRALEGRLALARHAVDDREVELVEVGVEVEEELLDLVDDLGDAGVGAVDLVDHEDHRQLAPRGPCAARSGSAGSGPSEASTSSSTPSTIDRPRSTSPPKSAWPGVSMMLIFTSP